uniref:Uncharacterized protein n=1 Tax=Panagrolaimus superbus TaxID=310955 RepID=A0A914Z956_9BILA
MGTSTTSYDESESQVIKLLSNDSSASGDQLFNETMTAVIVVTEEVDKLTHFLTKYTGTKTWNSERIIVAAIAIPAVVVFGVQLCTFATLLGSFGYNLWRSQKNAALAEQARITADERFKTLLAENKKLITEVKKVVEVSHDSGTRIVEKLDEKVKDPMNILMAAYDTYTETLVSQALMDLNQTCATHKPKDLIVVRKLLVTRQATNICSVTYGFLVNGKKDT